MFEFEDRQDGSVLPGYPRPSFEEIDRRVLYGAAAVGILVNMNAALIPIFRYLGGGLVAGFIAGYAGGRPTRGTVVGTLAGAIVGVVSGLFVLLLASLLGLIIEPPALLFRVLGPFNPAAYTRNFLFQLLSVYFVAVVAVAFDGLVGGVIGGSLKALVRLPFDES